MKRFRFLRSGGFGATCGLMVLLAGAGRVLGEPAAVAVTAYDVYVRGVEARLARQHQSKAEFLAAVDPVDEQRILLGELVVEHLTPAEQSDLPGALLEHWRGTAFVKGAKAQDLERLLRDFGAYPEHFSPQVLRASVVSQQGDRMQAAIRVRQKHVITVVMDTTYDVAFGRLDGEHGFSASRSVVIREIGSPGTEREHALGASEEHGFLWRLNTYWSYEERDGGLYVQIESVSLSRAIPVGLGWALRPYVESVPRESLEFTLKCAANAVRRQGN